tara:strand:- start:2196 stop:2498 length:303 start_codon:yes stop_codon:yes gene_type:complete
MNRKLIAYLDAVEGYVNSIARSIRNGEEKYSIDVYDTEEGCSWLKYIGLPSPQRTGTETQKRDYSLMKAREIVEDMKEWNPHLNYETFGTLPNEFEQDPA